MCGPCRCLPPTHTDNFLLINHTIQPSCSAPCEQLFSLICSRFIFFFVQKSLCCGATCQGPPHEMMGPWRCCVVEIFLLALPHCTGCPGEAVRQLELLVCPRVGARLIVQQRMQCANALAVTISKLLRDAAAESVILFIFTVMLSSVFCLRLLLFPHWLQHLKLIQSRCLVSSSPAPRLHLPSFPCLQLPGLCVRARGCVTSVPCSSSNRRAAVEPIPCYLP